ncbi:MAG: septum formation initiator family protein [Proteobacteria bacterium]|nr:septum formation initiator family protein [Pseudomonadota bacterium]
MAMQGDFYRKPRSRSRLREKLKGLLSNRRLMLSLLGGVVLLAYVLFGNRGVIARVRLELKRQEMIEKVQLAEQETKRLQAEKKALEGDKKTIEKVAREQHGMAREGETVYRIKKD